MYSKQSNTIHKKGKGKQWRKARQRRAELEQRRRKEARERRRDSMGFDPVQIQGESAEARYWERAEIFDQRFGRAGSLVHAAAWVTHNCVAHPLLGVAPGHLTLRFHDLSADWLNQSPVPTQSRPPQITDRTAWLMHNCVAHPLMGLAPLGIWFDLHESTADDMGVEGWV